MKVLFALLALAGLAFPSTLPDAPLPQAQAVLWRPTYVYPLGFRAPQPQGIIVEVYRDFHSSPDLRFEVHAGHIFGHQLMLDFMVKRACHFLPPGPYCK